MLVCRNSTGPMTGISLEHRDADDGQRGGEFQVSGFGCSTVREQEARQADDQHVEHDADDDLVDHVLDREQRQQQRRRARRRSARR